MTESQVIPQTPSIPAVPAQLTADLDGFVRLELLKRIAELADPMQSAIVKGWLQSDLRAPK